MLNYKLLLISLFGLFFLSGCSFYPDKIIIEDPVEVSLAQNDLGYDAWGRPKIINDFSLFHGLWTYDVPKVMWIIKENGIEILDNATLVTSYEGMLKVTDGGEVNSRRNARYQPNRGWLYSTATIMPNSDEIGVRKFGAFNDENGFLFSLEDGVLYAVRKTTYLGITTEFKEEINISNNVNLSLGNVYDIQAQWRGLGSIKFFINLELVHTMDLLGTLSATSISNPALPLTFKVTSGVNEILVGCVDLTSEGGFKENRQYNSLTTGELSLSTGETAMVVMKINETYHGKLNTRDIALRRITGYADDNTIMRVYYTRDPTIITGGTWLPNNGGNVQYQILPTFTSTIYTKKLVEGRIPAQGSFVMDNPDEAFGEFFLVAGDYIVITLEAKVNTDGGVTIEWGEEI